MIFQPELVRLIRQGRKTQTRRLVKTSQSCRYKPGKNYAVQPGRGEPAIARIQITAVRQERLGDIAYTDARAEGFATTDDFKTYWISVHDKAWLEHENRMLDEAEHDDGVVLDRDTWIKRRSLDMFEQWHADKNVWVIAFLLDATPRFLALRSDELYTTNPARALPGEPEAVDEDTQKWITDNANLTSRQWQAVEAAGREQDRALISREEQLTRLQRAARLRSVDISREAWALRNMLASNGDAFERKIRRAEHRVFRAAA
jgi:uncharacterized protein YhfF